MFRQNQSGLDLLDDPDLVCGWGKGGDTGPEITSYPSEEPHRVGRNEVKPLINSSVKQAEFLLLSLSSSSNTQPWSEET